MISHRVIRVKPENGKKSALPFHFFGIVLAKYYVPKNGPSISSYELFYRLSGDIAYPFRFSNLSTLLTLTALPSLPHPFLVHLAFGISHFLVLSD